MSNRNPIILVVGAGRIGRSVTRRLHASARFEVKLADPHHAALDWAKRANIRTYQLTAADYQSDLKAALVGVDVVVCAAPDFVTSDIARAAMESGCHYVDVAESIASKKFIQAIAEHAKSAFVPGCGLAPGLVTTLVSDMASIQGPDSHITAYVGVLPSKKINRMGYANIWGIDGLLAEYTTSCQVIKNGVCDTVEPLTGLETIYFEGQEYEAFNTAGTLDDLVPAIQGKIQGLEFKTLRFPGHLDYVQFLLDDLGLKNHRQTLKSLLRNGLPTVEEDQVIICIENRTALKSANTARTSHRTVIHFQSQDYADDNGSGIESAVSSTSSAHVCTIVDLLCCKGLQHNRGIIHHHNLTLDLIRQSSFFNEIQRCGF
jgi:saccharopine dehydrogenase-like NADP-dependent oxidoreductase